MFTTRCKFKLIDITQSYYNPTVRKLTFTATYDENIAEDIRFQKYTPSGKLEAMIDNQAVLDQLKLGDSYYLDITPVEVKLQEEIGDIANENHD